MAGNFKLDWKGPEVGDKIVRAAIAGVNQTISEAVVHAKENHPWRNRTGILERSIRPVVAAHQRGTKISGTWGSASVEYAVWQEIGTSRMPARPYLRPAADAIYPRLAENIRHAFEGTISAVTRKGLGIAAAFRVKFGPIK